MSRVSVRHMVTALGSGFVAGVLMLAVLALLNGGIGFGSCTAMTGLGWIVPLVAGLIIGGVALVLLDTSQSNADSSADTLRASTCASCGSPIISEWRMCPHCGALLECDMAVSTATSIPEL